MEVLFSTSITMTAATIIALYRARFSMEFPFRDGKRPSVLMGAVLAKTQFAGLNECQSRRVEALHFHWNMALMAVSAARLSQLRDQRVGPLVFSMEDEKRRAYNEFFAERILSILTVEGRATGQRGVAECGTGKVTVRCEANYSFPVPEIYRSVLPLLHQAHPGGRSLEGRAAIPLPHV